MSYLCATDTIPDKDTKWENGWKECTRCIKGKKGKKCCAALLGGVLISKHNLNVHGEEKDKRTLDSKIAKQAARVVKAIAMRDKVPTPSNGPAEPGPRSDEIQLLEDAPDFALRADELLNGGGFHKFSESLLGTEEREFLVNELTEVRRLDDTLHTRLRDHIIYHPKVDLNMRDMVQLRVGVRPP